MRTVMASLGIFVVSVVFSGCMAQEMPCGMYIRRSADSGFTKQYPTQVSAPSTEWLTYIEEVEKKEILHARNSAEIRLGPRKIPVDGYCE